MTEKIKTKRKLTNIDFSKDDSHIAVVHKDQGGGANGANYALVLKANKFSPEFVEKASKVKVTMDIQDFLAKFYGVYYDDAEVLARALGYDTERDVVENYEEYIDNKVAAIEIIKSLKETEGRIEKLAALNEEDYLTLLQSQSQLEPLLKAKETIQDKPAITSTSTDVENTKVEPAGSDKLEKSMAVEMVEKSALVQLEKALGETQEALTKALADVEVFKAREKEAVTKARLEKLVAAVKDEEKAQVLFKALNLMEDATEFDAAVAALATMTQAVEKSSLFEEKGAGAEADQAPKESAVAKAVKARQAAVNKSKE